MSAVCTDSHFARDGIVHLRHSSTATDTILLSGNKIFFEKKRQEKMRTVTDSNRRAARETRLIQPRLQQGRLCSRRASLVVEKEMSFFFFFFLKIPDKTMGDQRMEGEEGGL